MSDDNDTTHLYFHWADYLVFVASLLASLAIGVYYAVVDRKKQNNEDFLMGGRSMSIGPVTASTFATLVSNIGFLADPVEVYYFGVGYFFMGIGGVLSLIPIAQVFVPAFHQMNLVSAFEYLEQTYNPFIRKAASVLQLLLMLFFMGLMTYASAVSLAQVSGISVYVGMLITMAVCTIYTTFGGMKAVVWSAAIQTVLMFAGVLVLAFKAMADLGGWGPALEIVKQGQRSNYFNWNPNPFIRSSFWAYLVGGFFRALVPLSSTQMAIQRYCTLPTARQAAISVYLLVPLYLFLIAVFLIVGFAMFGHFAECDPMFSKQIESVDQFVPLLVMKVLGEWPGMPGLFISAIFAASLSSISSGQNALAATILTDMIQPAYLKKSGRQMSERRSFLVAKALAFGVGVIVLGMAFAVTALGGSLFGLFNKILGTFAGPVAGLFTLAILVKSVNNIKAVIFGFLLAVSITLWIAIGGEIYKFKPNILPLSVAGCHAGSPMVNETISYYTEGFTTLAGEDLTTVSTTAAPLPPSPFTDLEGFVQVYNLTPVYYSLMSYVLTILFIFLSDRIIKLYEKRKARKQQAKTQADGLKYDSVPTRAPSWEKEKPSRLSQYAPYIITKKDEACQTMESIPPTAHRDILWVYDTESTI